MDCRQNTLPEFAKDQEDIGKQKPKLDYIKIMRNLDDQSSPPVCKTCSTEITRFVSKC